MKTLYLVDASAMFFRAFFALPPLSNPKGMPTNALYGFYSMTQKLLKDEKPDYLVYCFDRKEPTFRNEMYAEYKATRDEMPEDLVPQVPYMRKFTDALNICSLDRLGFEADDIIGTLAREGEAKGYKVVIVSSDKDFAQLVTDKITLLDTMKDKRTDVSGVVEKWGVKPEQVIDYLAICGDSSDNVPGVRGIGPKGAQKLLSEYNTLENIYEHVNEVSPAGMQKKLVESKDIAFLSKKLVTIKIDMDLGFKLDSAGVQAPDIEKLRELLIELGFKTFEKNLNSIANPSEKTLKAIESGDTAATAAVARETVKSGDFALQDWNLEQVKANVPPYSEINVLFSRKGVAFESNKNIFLPTENPKTLGEILFSKNLKWSGFDLKEAFKELRMTKCEVIFDSKIAEHLIKSDKVGDLESLFEIKMGHVVGDLSAWEEYFSVYESMRKLQENELKVQGLVKVFNEIELPLIGVLAEMELKGIRIDTKELQRQSEVLTSDIRKLEGEIIKLAGREFNIGSPKQLSDILFVDLKLPAGKKTKTGYSTDSDVLESLKHIHPIAEKLIQYRELTKLKSTYVDALPLLVNKETGRLHTHLNQASTSTGRLSSTNPNLQNIPIRTERGREVRKAFISDKGNCLISADYSQIELRILAHIAKDKGLIQAFNKDQDIHTATAAEIFEVEPSKVNADLRRKAKAVNFGIAYGQGAFGLADTLGISRSESKIIIERYFERFPGVKTYMESVVHQGYEQGYVETLFGRKRYMPELKSKNQAIRKFGERAAINAPIQGTASDLVKLAMVKVRQELPIPLLLQVHDELIFECPVEDVGDWIPEIKTIMEGIHKMDVTLKVNVASGPDWDAAH